MRAKHETRFRCLKWIAATSFCGDADGRLIQHDAHRWARPCWGLIIVPHAAHPELLHA